MKNNFQTLISGILTKASALFPKKEDVYTKAEAASKEELNTLTPEDVGAAPIEHEHSYLQHRTVYATLPSSAYWQSVTYGNGKFVAVAYNSDKAAYSEDGINWTQSTLPVSAYWRSVTYGNGKFVAVSDSTAAYSEDGVDWITCTIVTGGARSITYGNGKFVAIEYYSNIAAYSEDGITWTETTLPVKKEWYSVTYGNGKFVAVVYRSNIAAYSEDGINWTETTLPVKEDWQSATYGKGKFVAVAYNSDKAAYSEDGINWTQTKLPEYKSWQSVTYSNDKFVAVGWDSDKAAYSEDGINWTETKLPVSDSWQSATYGNGKFVAISDSDKAAYSYDGITWLDHYEEIVQDEMLFPLAYEQHEHAYTQYKAHDVILPFSASCYAVTYGNGKFVALAYNSTTAAYSEDGIDWTQTTLPSPVRWYSVTYGNGKFVAVANYNNIAAYSEDGINWTQTKLPSSVRWQSVTYSNDKFVAVGWDSDKAAYSEDGINWTETKLPVSDSWQSATYGNGKFVAVGWNSDIAAYSEDGINWTQTKLPASVYWQSVTYGNGKFVAISSSDITAYSEDGITWTQTKLPSSPSWESVTYGNGKFVAVAHNSDKAAYSEDGITWTETKLPAYETWQSVIYGNGKFVAISNSSKVVYSRNGIKWYSDGSTGTLIQSGSVITPEQLGAATESYVDSKTAGLATKAYVDSAIAESGGSASSAPSAFIDVVELPTENINHNAIYRLLTAKFVNGGYIESWVCHCVDVLPSIGEPVSTDMTTITAYYNIQDKQVYGYADSMISAAGGVPEGWYPIEVLGQAFDISWGGVITDTDEDDGEHIRLLVSKEHYVYQDGWCKVPFAYEKAPKINIQWDGDMTGRVALDMSMLGFDQGLYFVKVSDDVFTTDELTGWIYSGQSYYDGGIFESEIYSDAFDTDSYPGAFTINDYITVVYDAVELATALGIPTGIYTNGIYFWLNTAENGGYTSNLTSPARITKIESKYLDANLDIDASAIYGLHSVATSGNYYDLYNRPDLNNYVTTSTLNSRLNSYVTTSTLNSSLNSYVTANQVDTKIAEAIESAIGSAIGGSY